MLNRLLLPALAAALALAGCTPAAVRQPAHVPSTLSPELMSHLHALDRPDNVARRKSLVAMLRTHGFDPVLHEFPNDGRSDPERETGVNVEITVGDGPREIIIGAHYDAVRLQDGTLSSGMIDNGASVIALLHVAEMMRERGAEHRLRFVFFDLEEGGLVGSRHYAQALGDDAPVDAMVNLDVNAYGDTVIYGSTDYGHAELYHAARVACARIGSECAGFPKYPPTDNMSFEAAGIRNISLSVLPQSEVHELWLLMNSGERSALREGVVPGVLTTIHSSADRFELVQPAAVVLACDMLEALLIELDAMGSDPI